MDERSASERTNALLRRYVLDWYRREHEIKPLFGIGEVTHTNHLAGCLDAVVGEYDASNGTYGCDTGCEYVRFEAHISCPHGEAEDWTAGEFGELRYIIEDLESETTS